MAIVTITDQFAALTTAVNTGNQQLLSAIQANTAALQALSPAKADDLTATNTAIAGNATAIAAVQTTAAATQATVNAIAAMFPVTPTT